MKERRQCSAAKCSLLYARRCHVISLRVIRHGIARNQIASSLCVCRCVYRCVCVCVCVCRCVCACLCGTSNYFFNSIVIKQHSGCSLTLCKKKLRIRFFGQLILERETNNNFSCCCCSNQCYSFESTTYK